ncbi:hypothetical protein Tco_0958443 [Tanacetum coccineum]
MLGIRHWLRKRIIYVAIYVNFLKDNFSILNDFTNVVIFPLMMSDSLYNSGIVGDIAPVLSHNISISLLLVGMAFPSPSIHFLIQTASIEAFAVAIYSAYVEDIVIMLCLTLFQSTTPPLSTKTYPDWDLILSYWYKNWHQYNK